MDRIQRACVNGYVSNWIGLKQGVPQWKYFKTLLLNLYMINLPEQVSKSVRLHLRMTVFCSAVTNAPIYYKILQPGELLLYQ